MALTLPQHSWTVKIDIFPDFFPKSPFGDSAKGSFALPLSYIGGRRKTWCSEHQPAAGAGADTRETPAASGVSAMEKDTKKAPHMKPGASCPASPLFVRDMGGGQECVSDELAADTAL
jgi:hypothetical protein